jgi:hypothetical protein
MGRHDDFSRAAVLRPAAEPEPRAEGEDMLEWILPSLSEDAADRRPRPAARIATDGTARRSARPRR